MKKKLILGIICVSLVTSSVYAAITNGDFTTSKHDFKELTSTFIKGEESDDLYNSIYDSLPPYAKLKTSLQDVYFTSKALNTYPDGMFTSGRTENSIGCASASQRWIVVDGSYMNAEDKDFATTGRRILYHEVGHAIDGKQAIDDVDTIEKRFGSMATEYTEEDANGKNPETVSPTGRYLYSDRDKFISIWQKEKMYIRDMYFVYGGHTKEQALTKFQDFKSNSEQYIKERDRIYSKAFLYWEGDPQEFFAESVSYYMTYPEEMQSVAPETYRYIDNVLNQKYKLNDNLGAHDVGFVLDYFVVESQLHKDDDFYINSLKQLIQQEQYYIGSHQNLVDELLTVKELGDEEQIKEYLKADIGKDNSLSFDDYFKNKENGDTTKNPTDNGDTTKNPTDNGDTTKNPTDNGKTAIKESGFVKDPKFVDCYGWIKRDEKWYYFDEKGNKAIGKFEENGKTYYFDENGQMKTGLIDNPDGSGKIYIDDFGTMKKIGWKEEDGKWYYINADGTIKTGWIQSSDKWYYLDSDGAMKTGWVQDSDKWYYLNPDGSMKTGWVNDNGVWYYLNSDGSMKTGWLNDNGVWYYLNGDGSMAVNTTTPDGYAVGSNGALV